MITMNDVCIVENSGINMKQPNQFAALDRSDAKKYASLLVITILALVICDAVFFQGKVFDAISLWMYYNDGIVLGLYIFLMILATWFFVPPSLLVLASGFIFPDVYVYKGWGIAIAWISSVLGAMIGGTLAYGRAPGLSNDLLKVICDRYPILSVTHPAIVNNPLKVMMLLRLNPLLPFGVLNCVFAMKGVDLALFLVAIVAVMPWYLFLVCVGAAADSIIFKGSSFIGYTIAVVCGAVVMVVAWAMAKDELLVEVGEANKGVMKRLAAKLKLTQSSRGRSKSRSMFSRGRSTSTSRSTSRSSRSTRSSSRSRSRSRSRTRGKSGQKSEAVVEQPVDSNIVEYSDLSGADYVRMQILGEDNDPTGGNKAYRNKLDVAEIILDDFS